MNFANEFNVDALRCFNASIKFDEVYMPFFRKHLHNHPMQGIDWFRDVTEFQDICGDAGFSILRAADTYSFVYVDKFKKAYEEICHRMACMIRIIEEDNMYEIIPRIIKMHELYTKMYYRISFPGRYIQMDNGVCIVFDD